MRTACVFIVILVPLLFACNTSHAQDGSSAAFITTLGDDTLAVERFQRTPSGMTADVVLRSPQTTVRSYEIEFDEQGSLQRYEATTREPGEAGAELQRDVVVPEGDSLRFTSTQEGQTQERAVLAEGATIPFVDMVHWPFELALTRAADIDQDSVVMPMFTGRGSQPFVLRRKGEDRMSIQHPFRGTMEVEVDAEGRLQRLDASRTTRALTVERVEDVDVEAIAERFAAEDAAGRSFGALSGRAQTEATVDGATIVVDYGQPAKRGREVWGELVPYEQIWRTGANRATHIETDQTLVFDGLEVPPGEYTLFTMVRPDGGILIFNRQTGQTGTAHDPDLDLGEVELTPRPLSGTAELFTIDVEDTPDGGELKLQWDDLELVAPFSVR